MKIAVVCGGTGGHINPGIALADYIKRRKPDADILFIGTPGGMENTLVKNAGYEIRHVDIMGFKRKISAQNIRTVMKIFSAQKEAEKIFKEFRPDLVVGTGGYVSGPAVYKAAKMGIKTAIHEQNAFPGITTKLLANKVDKIMLSFKESEKFFRKGAPVVFTGNPVREEILSLKKDQAKRKLGIDSDVPFIVSVGGSLGALVFNRTIAQLFSLYPKDMPLIHYHASGKRYYPELSTKLEGENVLCPGRLQLFEYFYDFPTVLAAADIVISRAGAITLSEIAAQGKCAIFIPSPNVAENHQYKNALVFKEKNAGILIEEKDLTAQLLFENIKKLIDDPALREQMGFNAGALAVYDATERIYNAVMSI